MRPVYIFIYHSSHNHFNGIILSSFIWISGAFETTLHKNAPIIFAMHVSLSVSPGRENPRAKAPRNPRNDACESAGTRRD
jgi:hypothetical protein